MHRRVPAAGKARAQLSFARRAFLVSLIGICAAISVSFLAVNLAIRTEIKARIKDSLQRTERSIEQARADYAADKVEQAMQAYAVAVDLYHAPFLAEDRYEEWTDEPRRANQAMYLEALHRLARYHVERGEQPAAILLCQRALAEESCDEESHQMLMACYMEQGLRHLAVRQFQICASALKTELGLSPSEELESFYRRVLAAS